MSSFSIREVTIGEAPECAAVIRRSFATVAAEFKLTRENCPMHGAFMDSVRLAGQIRNGVRMFALFAGEVMTGCFGLEDNKNGVFYLQKLAVLPEYRHAGYGKKMLDYSLGIVKQLGGTTLTISIMEQNMRLKSWYLNYGFKHTGVKNFEKLPFLVGFLEYDCQ